VISIRLQEAGDDEVLDRVDAQDLRASSSSRIFAGAEVGGDRCPGDAGDRQRR
jgi:hypothetical protein